MLLLQSKHLEKFIRRVYEGKTTKKEKENEEFVQY
jgi:hypothetical protein